MNTINFTRGVPANESFPIPELIDAASTVLRTNGPAMLQYGPSPGFPPLRDWLAEWQQVSPDQVLTGNGSLQLIEFLCLHMLSPGDVVFTESPTYDRTLSLLRRHGATVVGIAMEPDGPNVEALERALATQVPKFFYVIPDFQNPAGATCSGAKRRRLVELAARHGFLLVEDAPYRLLRYRGEEEPTLHQLAPEHTLHMSSFTKLIAPGVRTGFMIGGAAMIAKLAKIAEDTYISPGYVAQAITYEWCRRGLLDPQLERLKRLYAPRLDACLAGLDTHMPEAKATRPDGGFFVSLTLPDGVTTTAVRARAAERGLNLSRRTRLLPRRRRRTIRAAALLRALAGRDRRGHQTSGGERHGCRLTRRAETAATSSVAVISPRRCFSASTAPSPWWNRRRRRGAGFVRCRFGLLQRSHVETAEARISRHGDDDVSLLAIWCVVSFPHLDRYPETERRLEAIGHGDRCAVAQLTCPAENHLGANDDARRRFEIQKRPCAGMSRPSFVALKVGPLLSR